MSNNTKLLIIAALTACVLLGCITNTWGNSTTYLSLEPALPDGSTLIRYNPRNTNTTSILRNRLDTFLKRYYDADPYSSDYYKQCQRGTPPEPGSNSVCVFDKLSWTPICSSEFAYGFEEASKGPCIYLVFNNVPDWKPEYYNISALPTNMPIYFKHTIQQDAAKYGPDSARLNIVWASCEGKNARDKENIGPILYSPIFAFDGAYFPIENKDAYLNPLVAMHFENPKRGVLINMECKAWARNLNHEKGEGVLHFELLID